MAATIFTGLSAQKDVEAYGGLDIPDRVFFDGNTRQLGAQIIEVIVGFIWVFFGSYIVVVAPIDCVPGLEVLPVDKSVLGRTHN